MAPKAGRGRGNRARGDKKKKEEKSMQSYPSILPEYFSYTYILMILSLKGYYCAFDCSSLPVVPAAIDVTVVTPYESQVTLKVLE